MDADEGGSPAIGHVVTPGRETGRPAVARAKIAIPQVTAACVSRPRLLAALDAAPEHQVVLVSAPAGYGKTLLLADWVAHARDATAWLSLDPDDDSDRRFWAGVLAALTGCPAVPADNALHTVALPPRPGADPDFLAEVCDALAAVPDGLRLVLDDVHEVRAPDTLHGLAMLVRDRPPGLRLVLSGRSDPPLPLARMRLAGHLAELRAADLRFSAREAEEALRAAGHAIHTDQVRMLVERTDGWAAGLRLAAMSLSASPDPDRFPAEFTGDDMVSDYLVGEVLSHLPDRRRDFLRAVSVCDELTVPLAVLLSEQPDAGEMLDALERETSLVVSLGSGRRWYRVQPLLRAYLRADLRRTRPELAAELHVRTAGWFLAKHQPERALTHAARAGDRPRLAAMLQEHAMALVASGEHAALRAALRELGDHDAADPWLALVSAYLHIQVGALVEADDDMRRAEQAWPAAPSARETALRQLVVARRAAVGGDPAAMVRATDATPPVPEDELALTPVVLLHRANALLAAGQAGSARELAESAHRLAREEGQSYLAASCLTVLAGVAAIDGDYRRMALLAEQADARLSRDPLYPTEAAAATALLRAYGALLDAEPDRCLELAARAVRFVEVAGREFALSLSALVLATRGAALFDRGDRTAGLAQLGAARRMIGSAPVPARQVALTAVYGHRAAALLGRSEEARQVLDWAHRLLGPVGDVLLMQARSQAAAGRAAAARELLRPLLDGTSAPVLGWVLVDGRLLDAELQLQTGARPLARRSAALALSLAEEMAVLRPLATAPAEVVELAGPPARLGALRPFAERVAAARRALGWSQAPVALTERERTVLGLLPTLRSLDEIATDLMLSTNTVKTHVRSIYGKLGVGNRRDAVSAAQRAGLVPAHGEH